MRARNACDRNGCGVVAVAPQEGGEGGLSARVLEGLCCGRKVGRGDVLVCGAATPVDTQASDIFTLAAIVLLQIIQTLIPILRVCVVAALRPVSNLS